MIGMVITNNLAAMNAQRQFNIVGNKKKKATEKLSSGYKINRAADDAAGLTISEKMRSQIRGLTQGVDNTQDGISLLQVADGALAEVHDMLHKITELSVKSANETNTKEDREAIQAEITEILTEIDRISDSTEFNTRKLFKGQKKILNPVDPDPSIPVEDPHETMLNNSNAARSSIRSTLTATSSLLTDFNKDFTFITKDTPRSLSVNGSEINLGSVSGSEGSLASETIKAGNYSFSNSGVTFSFSLDKDYSQEEVLRAINGLELNVKGSVETIIPARMSINPNDGQYAPNDFFGPTGVRTHTLSVSETGVALDGGTLVSWSSVGVDLNDRSTFAGKVINVVDPDTNVKYSIRTHESVDKSSFINYLKQASVTSNINLPHTTTHFRADENTGTIDRTGTYFFTYTKALYDKMGVNYGAPITNTLRFEGSSTDDFKIVLRSTATGVEQDFKINSSDVSSVLYPGGEGWVRFEDDTGSCLKMYIKNKTVSASNFYSTLKSRNPVPDKGMGIWYTEYKENYHKVKKLNLTQGNATFSYSTDAWDYDNPEPIDPEEPEPYDVYKEYDDLSLWIQSGAHSGDGMYIKIGIMDTNTLGVHGVNVSSVEGARRAMESVKRATSAVSDLRSGIGAQQNRLEHTVDNENNIVENTTAAESRIRDTDMAKESANLAVQNILTQAGVAMMSQANQSAQGVLQLLQ